MEDFQYHRAFMFAKINLLGHHRDYQRKSSQHPAGTAKPPVVDKSEAMASYRRMERQ